MSRRSSFSRRATPGTSTLARRDAAAKAIAERVDRFFRWEERDAKTDRDKRQIEGRLVEDLRRLADAYREADKKHESLSVDSLATADAAALLERIRVAPFDSAQRKRVYKAAVAFLTRPGECVRQGSRGPVLLEMVGETLYGHQNGRVGWISFEEALGAPRLDPRTYEHFIGPELPPAEEGSSCHCSRDERWRDLYPEPCAGGLLLERCPNAHPCAGGCGRAVTGRSDWCRFCKHSRWTAPPWKGIYPRERVERPKAPERPVTCPDCGAGLPADGSCCDVCGWPRDERCPRKPSGRTVAEIDREKCRRSAKRSEDRRPLGGEAQDQGQGPPRPRERVERRHTC